MELPRAALIIQRGLAVILLLLVGLVAAVEYHSPFSARLRTSKPWPFWLSVREPGRAAAPAVHLGVYDPLRRTLVLLRIPETTKLEGKLTAARAYTDALRATDDPASAARAVEDLAQAKISALSLEPIAWEGAGRLALDLEAGEDDEEPAAVAARELKARGRSPRALWRLCRRAASGLLAGDRAAADPLLLTLELRRTALENLQPALLPDDALAPVYLARIFAPPAGPRTEDRAIVAEALNGTDVQGLATQAAKILRSKGVDVVTLGQARPLERTYIFDRTGDFDRAARVRAALGCPSAIAATRIDPLRGVDVSVELGQDCRY